MSVYWDQKNYIHAFKYKMYQKNSLRSTLTYKYYPCPGCILHIHPRNEILFEHFNNRPQKSYALYWKTHPQEYKTMIAGIKKHTIVKH